MLSPSWLSDLVSNVKKETDLEATPTRQPEMNLVTHLLYNTHTNKDKTGELSLIQAPFGLVLHQNLYTLRIYVNMWSNYMFEGYVSTAIFFPI